MLSLIRAGFDTLEARREQLTERFFRRSVLPETSCLYYLLPSNGPITIAIRARFEYDSTTTRYEVFRALAYEIVYENQW